MNKHKKWCIGFLGIMLVSLFTMGFAIYSIDPYQIYNFNNPSKEFMESRSLYIQRYLAAGFAKNLDYETILVGSSMSENMTVNKMDEAFDTKSAKLSISGGTPYEIKNVLKKAISTGKVKNAIVLDVGGTTSDLGVLYNGFPRESSIPVTIGGVHTNFRMPDVLTIGLAGGTCVKGEKDNIKIGPESVGYRITEDAIIFGGDTLTLSDVVTKLDMAFEDRKSNVENLDKEYCNEVYKKVILNLEDAVDQMKTSQDDVELVLTGGGSIIVPEKLKGISNVIRPPHYTAANAIGAALGQISGDVEKVYSLDKMSREDAIEDAKKEAVNKALKAGAKEDTIEVLNIEDVPLAYLPGNALLIKVKVVGDLI